MIKKESFSKSHVTILQKSKDNQDICGDSYIAIETKTFLLLAIADGLGSGKNAQMASKKAADSIEQNKYMNVSDMLLALNEDLRGTRGAVVGIMKLSYTAEEITYDVIGNIQLVIMDDNDHFIRPFSKPGYISGRPIQVREKKYKFKRDQKIVLFSDGVQLQKRELRKIQYSHQDYASLLEEMTKKEDDDITIIIAEPAIY